MTTKRTTTGAAERQRKLTETVEVLRALGFGPKQHNEAAAYTLLAVLDLTPSRPWSDARDPLRGITPIIEFVRESYRVRYAPNTRETIRDEAVEYFVESGMLIRNSDDQNRPTNSGKTVYQVEPNALALFRSFQSAKWKAELNTYLASRELIRRELFRHRETKRVPVTLPSGDTITLSPGGQNPLIRLIIEEFCPRFVPGGTVIYIGDAAQNFFVFRQGSFRHALR